MSIHKHSRARGGFSWEVRLRGPDRRESSKRFKTRKEAEHYEREQQTAMSRGVWTDPRASKITLAAWAQDWQRTTVHLAGRTKCIYADNLRLHILPALGHFELGKLTTPMCRSWLSELSVKPKRGGGVLAPTSVHQAYRTLRTLFGAAVDNGYLGRNPLDGVKPPKKAPKGPMRSLEVEEVRRLAEVIDERFRALVWLGAFCGLRRGEMLALRWENVNMVGRRIDVVEQMDPSGKAGAVKAPKSLAGRRTISMPSIVVDALAEHAARENAREGAIGARTGLVFTAANGGPVDVNNFGSRTWKRAVDAAGLHPLPLHNLRHTCASLAISTGASVKVIQSMLGHASAAMTLDTYGHLMPSESEAVADRMDALVRRVV